MQLIETLLSNICPLNCFTSVVTKDTEDECFFKRGCSRKCKDGLKGLSRDCRNAQVRATDPELRAAAMSVFDKCGLDYDLVCSPVKTLLIHPIWPSIS